MRVSKISVRKHSNKLRSQNCVSFFYIRKKFQQVNSSVTLKTGVASLPNIINLVKSGASLLMQSDEPKLNGIKCK